MIASLFDLFLAFCELVFFAMIIMIAILRSRKLLQYIHDHPKFGIAILVFSIIGFFGTIYHIYA